jgi:HEAT repeat protein
MRKRRTLLICLIVAAIALVALLAHSPTFGEPSYEGHPLSYWVAMLGTPPRIGPSPDVFDYSDNERATNAIDHIGAAALPFLLKWIQYQTPSWRTSLASLLFRTRYHIAERLSDWIVRQKTDQLAAGVPYAFDVLGKRAMPVFDDLCRLMNDSKRPETAPKAAMALGSLGTNALPPLLAVVVKTNHPAQWEALFVIHQMSDLGNSPTLVTMITNCLSDANSPDVQQLAVFLLGNLKAAPQISVPALLSRLNSTNNMVRHFSADALGEFGPEAVSAIPALTNALMHADADLQDSFVDALHKIDPVAFTNTAAPRIVH